MTNALIQDVRYSLRLMRRSPGFTGVAVLSLALGIGANTAIFSLMYAVMLRMLPVEHPEQLVELLHRLPREGHRGNSFSWQAYQDLRDNNHVLAALIAASPSSFSVHGEGLDLEKVDGSYVDGNFFPGLGMRAAIGRLIGPEDRTGAAAVAVLSWSYWNSRFHADGGVLGKHIFVQDLPVTIVGVAPRGFAGWQLGARQDIWLPMAMAPTRNISVQLVGRLKPGVSRAQAHAELAGLDKRIVLEQAKTSSNPFTREVVLDLEPAGAGLTSPLREEYAKPLMVMMAVVAVLLIIACTNVASLLLARGAARKLEMALRVSLGASRFRLLRQVLTESVLLSTAGSLFGIVLAYFGTSVLARIITSGPRHIELQARPEGAVLLFTAGVSLLTGLLFGLAPALRASSSAPVSALRGAGISTESGTRFWRLFGKGLVVAQVALSVVLLGAAGLFVRYLSNLENLDLGFHRDHVLLVTLDPARSGYDAARLSRAYQDLLAHLEGIPGVRSATLSAVTPISGAGAARNVIVEGYQAQPGEIRLIPENWVAPKYFETLGTPLLAGRDFGPQDEGGPPVAIINQLMASYYFGDRSPLGMHISFDKDRDRSDASQPAYEIVGVVGDAKYQEIREKTWRTIYLDAFQARSVGSQFSLRTSVNPTAVIPAVRRAVRESLKTVPVLRVATLAEQVDASIVPERLIALLSGLFGALGAVLAAIGLYGLLAYTVARRISEIGIRMALGATRGNVIRMVLVDALAMVCAGLAIGVPIAYRGKTFAASLIQDLPVSSAAPIVFGALAMIAIALFAAYVPARRAARVDPMEALRHE